LTPAVQATAAYTLAMTTTVFVGGGNMASAIVGGLRRAGRAAEALVVVDPDPAARERIAAAHGVRTLATADASLAEAATWVWAVKPQLFRAAAAPIAQWVGGALQISVMAGIRSDAIAAATGSERIVRAMPNTPALIGQGISGLYARPAVDAAGRAEVEAVLAPSGRLLWLPREADLDAVTALSGSGPAYVFYIAEAMVAAALEMGLTAAQGRELALATFAGASALASQAVEPLDILRERVTSKGGTTHAAIECLKAAGVAEAFGRALRAARDRAHELGDEFG
jgi:pyrroline-5-carboxylate reductase